MYISLFRPSKTPFPFPGSLIPWSIIIVWHWDITDIRYSAEVHIYISLHNHQYFPIFYLMLTSVIFFNIWIKRFLCAVVVSESCLLLSDKRDWNNAWCGHDFADEFITNLVNALKCSNAIPSIDTDIFPP